MKGAVRCCKVEVEAAPISLHPLYELSLASLGVICRGLIWQMLQEPGSILVVNLLLAAFMRFKRPWPIRSMETMGIARRCHVEESCQIALIVFTSSLMYF